ncbi:uncharacterized protein (TIGR02145 family) [Parabacteroides sp. PF5-5]|uniref:FISUMP domain-containing protein n=1 Tax=unclassified Parabacteroides TaxID=2649774 RepID=UPI0024757171|nr:MULTISPECIES: FISUMP domain-containing protein [unclassified Parabacteroides]MDH6304148.1 uncharacterized protein (TIGR02145 family) [Parabacteroides sp. PH5-39]MDH6315152.1 uncharacterized protein (TIGR02145 family) [Parabacteroides sp. PF5-13]MDH6318797.1 uncharacterized protein (TIGR02145 family) [Parabacteroides sp. PH5-13]MDH6322526.1 uncharacterized protein (TIGR02145 family) [Parabacteroides sp. PH5-8]MDH6326322.1 uncharacterized protein (TIGR02145 family) [Parabacteroides sp. PH5-41
MIKQTVFQCLLFAALLFLAACNEETVLTSPPEYEGEGSVTFTLPLMTRGAVSYSIAGASENELSDITIYMFNDNSKKLEKVFRMADIELGTSGTNRTAKINVTGKSGKKTFYFVGNGENRSADLANLNVGATSETDFVEAITDMHTDTLVTPLLMSGKTIITEVSTPDDKPLELKVDLKRRVVRLDIDNNPKETNFDIKKILVSKAKLRGYIFEDKTATPLKSIEEANYKPIEIEPKDLQAPERLDSVFYLYPTTIGVGTGKTEIALEGIFNGETKVYNLNIADLEAQPNKRYILKVKTVDLNKAEMEIKVEDWVDEVIGPANPETDLVTFSAIKRTDATGIVVEANDTYNLTKVIKEGKLTFTTSSFNEKGTKAEVKYNWGSASSYGDFVVNTPIPVLTYSGASYVQEYEIDIPNINGSKVPVEVEITIRNEANLDQKKVITLYANRYTDTKLYPVLVGDIYWAPVNAGVSGPDAKVTDHGLIYQWGRNVGFTYEAGLAPVTDTIKGPLDWEVATTGSSKDKFITGSNASKGDWLAPQNHDLWSGDDRQGPCPNGWRVPTEEELKIINTAYGNNYSSNGEKVIWNDTEKRLEVKGDNETDILYLPASGYRLSSNGSSKNRTAYGGYWSSGVGATAVSGLNFQLSGLAMGMNNRASGRSLRCVQDW